MHPNSIRFISTTLKDGRFIEGQGRVEKNNQKTFAFHKKRKYASLSTNRVVNNCLYTPKIKENS